MTLSAFPLCDRYHFLCRAFLTQEEPCSHEEANLHPFLPQVLNTLNLPPLSVTFPFIVFPRSGLTMHGLDVGAFSYCDLPGFIKHKFSQCIHVTVTVSFILRPNHTSFYDNHINYPFLDL